MTHVPNPHRRRHLCRWTLCGGGLNIMVAWALHKYTRRLVSAATDDRL